LFSNSQKQPEDKKASTQPSPHQVPPPKEKPPVLPKNVEKPPSKPSNPPNTGVIAFMISGASDENSILILHKKILKKYLIPDILALKYHSGYVAFSDGIQGPEELIRFFIIGGRDLFSNEITNRMIEGSIQQENVNI